MGLVVGNETFSTLWASDVDFDGIRLEIYDRGGEWWFDVSVPEAGPIAINTFSREVPHEVITAAVAMAQRRS